MFHHINVKDYPSVGQVAMQLEKENIQPIFAVTKDVENMYKVKKIDILINMYIISAL